MSENKKNRDLPRFLTKSFLPTKLIKCDNQKLFGQTLFNLGVCVMCSLIYAVCVCLLIDEGFEVEGMMRIPPCTYLVILTACLCNRTWVHYHRHRNLCF